jgi:glycosyltransferase involved in cell wall biosynthesis
VIVGYDVTPLQTRGAGVARYTLELLRALRETQPDLELRLLLNRKMTDQELDIELAPVPKLRAPNFPSRLAWMQAILPVALAAQRADVCHFTNFDGPLVNPRPSVVALHDVSLQTMPELHPQRRVTRLRALMRLAAQRASRVVCLTEIAPRAANARLDLDPARGCKRAAGVAPAFRPLDDGLAVAATCDRYGVQPGYVLFTGTIEPRKNLVTLARAYAQLRAEGFDRRLVMCGDWGWKSGDLRPAIESLGIADDVVFTDHVPDDDLVALINGAAAFVYPSLHEGFGIPIIEAMACGVPVVTSNRGALAEVAGGAAILADPTDADDLAAAMRRALTDPVERSRLRVAGLERAAAFSWRNAAHQARAAYEAALGR